MIYAEANFWPYSFSLILKIGSAFSVLQKPETVVPNHYPNFGDDRMCGFWFDEGWKFMILHWLSFTALSRCCMIRQYGPKPDPNLSTVLHCNRPVISFDGTNWSGGEIGHTLLWHTGDWNLQDWKMTDHQKTGGGICRTGQWRKKSQGWKMTDWKMTE